MPDGASFCPKCGESTSPNQVNDDLNTILDSAFFSPTQKVILKPDELGIWAKKQHFDLKYIKSKCYEMRGLRLAAYIP